VDKVDHRCTPAPPRTKQAATAVIQHLEVVQLVVMQTRGVLRGQQTQVAAVVVVAQDPPLSLQALAAVAAVTWTPLLPHLQRHTVMPLELEERLDRQVPTRLSEESVLQVILKSQNIILIIKLVQLLQLQQARS
jgi:hypothetical protein